MDECGCDSCLANSDALPVPALEPEQLADLLSDNAAWWQGEYADYIANTVLNGDDRRYHTLEDDLRATLDMALPLREDLTGNSYRSGMQAIDERLYGKRGQ